MSNADIKVNLDEVIKPECESIMRKTLSSELCGKFMDDTFESLTRILHDASTKLPKSKFRKHLKPYWNHKMDALKSNKIRAYKIWVNAGRPREANDHRFQEYKLTKMMFSRKLCALCKEYENSEVLNAVKTVENDRNSFWRLVKKTRKPNSEPSISIKNSADIVVHGIEDVLEVWKVHFEKLGTPRSRDSYNDNHLRNVTKSVKSYNLNVCGNDILMEEFKSAIKALNKGKAPGYDRVTGVHIQFAGGAVWDILLFLYNGILHIEYIPVCVL